MNTRLSPNSLAFIALCNEYCAAMEHASQTSPLDFAKSMLKLLPRIYISASDIDVPSDSEAYIEPAMTEAVYDSVRQSVASLMGEYDTYLDAQVSDMTYSDTPIAASISEGLTDIMQPLFNFVALAKDAPTELLEEALATVAEDFREYWSGILCTQLRELNKLVYSGVLDADSQ